MGSHVTKFNIGSGRRGWIRVRSLCLGIEQGGKTSIRLCIFRIRRVPFHSGFILGVCSVGMMVTASRRRPVVTLEVLLFGVEFIGCSCSCRNIADTRACAPSSLWWHSEIYRIKGKGDTPHVACKEHKFS